VIDLAPALGVPGVRVAVSTRSEGSLGFTGAPDREAVRAARREFLGGAGVAPADAVSVRQVHGAKVLAFREEDRGKGGLDPDLSPGEADGATTGCAGLGLLVLGADCVVAALAADDGSAVAAFHAGWRGAAAGAPVAAVEALVREYGVPPSRLRAVLGPAIGPCCYEVGPEVAEAFRATGRDAGDWLRPGPRGRPHLDLPGVVRAALIAAGLPAAAVGPAGQCTACDREGAAPGRGGASPDRWFSHRRGDGGRQGLVVARCP